MADNQRITLDVEDPWATTKQNAIELDVEDPWAVKKPKEDLSDKYVKKDRQAKQPAGFPASGVTRSFAQDAPSPDILEKPASLDFIKEERPKDTATVGGEAWKGVKSGLRSYLESTASLNVYGDQINDTDLAEKIKNAKSAGEKTFYETQEAEEKKNRLFRKEIGEEQQKDAAAVGDIRDIESVSDFGKWASWNMGQMGGQMLGIIPFMLGGGKEKAGAEVAVSGFQALKSLVSKTPGTSGQFGKFLAQWAKPKAVDIPIGVLEGGSIAGGQLDEVEQGKDTELHPFRGLAAAFVATKLEELGAENAVNNLIKGIGGKKGNLIKRIAQSTVGTGVGEGTEEFFQTYAEQFGINPNDIASKETFMQAVNGAAAGFVGGFGIGGVTGSLSRNKDVEPGSGAPDQQLTDTSLADAINQGGHKDLDDASLEAAIQTASELVNQNPNDAETFNILNSLQAEAEARKQASLETETIMPQVETKAEQAAPDYSALITTHAEQNGIEPSLLSAVAKADGGLMAISPQVAQYMGMQDAQDPDQNLEGGARYLSALLQHYQGNEVKALAAYKLGVAAVSDQFRIESAPKEVQDYIASVQSLNPIGVIASGLRTGQVNGQPFGPNEAVSLIQQKMVDGTFTKDHLNALKDKHPVLSEPLNDLIAASLAAEINQAAAPITQGGLGNEESQTSETLLNVSGQSTTVPYQHTMGQPVSIPFGQQQTPTYMAGKKISGPKFAPRPETPPAPLAKANASAGAIDEAHHRGTLKQKTAKGQFSEELTASYSGQDNLTLSIKTPDGEKAGSLEYVVFDGKPSISMIRVPDNMRRKGYATALLHELQSKFPGQEIEWGMQTEAGTKLYDSLNIAERPSQEAPKFSELDNLKKEYSRLQSIADDFYNIENPSEAQRESFSKAIEPMNDIDNRIYELENELRHKKPTIKTIEKSAAPIVGSSASWTRGKETFSGTIQSIDEKNNLKIKAENGKVYSIRPDKVKDFKINPANTIDQGEIVDSRANGEAVISPVIPQTSENIPVEGVGKGKTGRDLAKIAESAIIAFPDMNQTSEGLIPLSRFTPEEAQSMRDAGIVEVATSSQEGYEYEGVNDEYLWERRKQIQNERKAQKVSQVKQGESVPEKEPIVTAKKSKKKGPQNIITRILAEGGLNVQSDYSNKYLKQYPDLKRAIRNTGISPDDMAAILKDEGYLGFESGDELVELLKEGKGKETFTPENLGDKIESRIRSMEDEWIEEQLANLAAAEEIDPGAVEESRGDILDGLEGKIAEEGLSEADAEAALDELSDFFESVAPAKEETAAPQEQSVKESYTEKAKAGTLETAEIPGASFAETFALAPSPGALGEKPKPHETNKTANLFEEARVEAPEVKEQPVEKVDVQEKPEAAEESAKVEAVKIDTLVSYDTLFDRVYEGNITPEELKTAFSDLIAAKDSILRELTKLTKDTLLKRMGGMGAYRYKNDTKGVIVKAVYQDMLSSFTIGRGISFGFGKGEYEKALQKLVDNTTDEDIKSFAKQVAERREEYKKRIQEVKKALDNPETLDEFQEFIRLKGKDKLTPEQLRQYDELAATDARESKKTEAERKGRIQEAGATVGAQIVETKHTKKGHDLFVVQLAERVDREVYNKLNIAAKKMGGYYSSFRGNGAVPGFQFTTRETAEAFQKLASEGDTQTATEVAQERKEARTDEKETKAVSRMREIASRLAKKANESLNQDRLTNTSRRARMADSAEAAARRELQIAETMNNIADAIESGEAKHLVGLRTKVQVELLNSMVNEAKRNELSKKYESYSEQEQHKGEPATEETVDYISPNLLPRLYKGNIRYLAQHASKIKGVMRLAEKWEKKASGQDEYYQVKSLDEIDELSDMATKSGETTNTIYLYGVVPSNRLHSMGIETPEMERAALREFIKFRSGMKKADKAKELERSLIGKNVGIDFFPTPKETAKRMIEEAGIKEGMDVLEPSAGNGNIAEVIRESGVEPDVVEVSGSLREILEAKNFNLVGQDFTDYAGKLYDRIIMNPPFSKNQDIEHVKHAYELLKPGGRIVAIMGEGAFFRNDKTATGFREWLEEVGGTEEKLPEGTFADRTLMSTTGANARLVAIDKPSEIQTRETDTGVEMYSLKEEEYGEISTGGVTESDLKDLFPGQKIEKVGNLYVVTTKGGGFFLVENVERIDRNNGKVMLGYGRKMKQNEVISGSYLKGEIKISKSGDVWTLAHESIHYLEDAGLLDERDIAVLKAHVRRLVANKQFKTNNRNDIGGAEDRADFLMDAMSQRPKYTGLVGRVMDKVYRIVDAMGAMFGKRTVDAIIREVKSGEVYNKPVTRKLGMPLAEPSESDINRYMTSRKGTGENIPPKTTQQPEGGEPKWYSFGSEARKKYFDPDSIREKGNYDIWDHDEGKWWTFRDKAHEQSFREKYPLAFLTEEPAGAEKTWYRFGNPPQGNRSVNFADNKGEAGVSVYATPEGNNPFFADRDVYSGPGRQIGWGSDGEPLIIPTGEWKKFNPNPSRPPEVGGQDDVAVKERYKVEQATASPEKPRLKTVEELVKWLNDQSKATDDPFTETTRKQSSLSKKTYKQALESTLIAEDKAPDVLEYDVMPMQEQADLAADLINKDIAKAKRIALGQEEPEGKLRKGTVYRAVELWAHDQGDTELIAKLIRSPISLEMTKQGQEIAATRKKHLMETLGMKYYESPVNAVRDVEDILRENIEKRTGKKVSKEAEAEAEAWEKKFAELNKTITDQAAEIKKYTSQEYIDELIKKHGKEGKPRTVKPRAEYGAKNKVVTRESYEQAKQEWHKMFGSTQLHAGIDPSAIALLTRIGAYHFEAGARQFAAWAQKVVDDTHPSVKPYLKEVFEKAKAAFGQSLTQKIKKGIEKGRDLGELQRHVTDLTISFIEEGITDGNEVVEAVHDELRQIDPEITLEETRDAISGYGNWKPLTHDDVLDRYREIKQEQQLVAKLRDLQEKGTIEKTGRERQEMTPLARDLTKQVNELKKKYGLSMTDPETQLRSALEAYKRRLEQQIADLDREIKTKEKIVREKYDLPLDQEAKELKAERDQKKATRDSIFGKPELSDEQRLRLALQAAKRSAAEYARRIAEHDFSPLLKNRKALTSEALNKAKKDRDDARKAYQELREAEHPGEAALKALETRLNNELNRYKQMIANRDFTKQERKPRNLSPELKRLMEQRDTMRMGVRAAAEAAGRLTNEDIERIAKLASVVTELREAIGNGGDRLAYGAAVVAYHNYIEDLKGINDPIKTLLSNRIQQYKAEYKENPGKAIFNLASDSIKSVFDNSVAMVASFDDSFMGRQGLKVLFTHPSAWWPGAKNSVIDFIKTLGGQETIDAMKADIYSRPNFVNGSYGKAGIIAAYEEQYPANLAERAPVIGRVFKASEAAFVGSGMRMRADLYDLLADQAKSNGKDVLDQKEFIEPIGKLINNLTARGSWGKHRGESRVTRLILWAPKMLMANINTLVGVDYWTNLRNPTARREAGLNWLKVIGTTALIMAVASALGGDDDWVEWDPRSTDFGKIKIGDTRFDITGGMGSIVVLAARIITGKKKSATTGIVQGYTGDSFRQSRLDAFVQFLINKTTPPMGIVRDWLEGKTPTGERFTPEVAIYRAMTPIAVQNFIKLKDSASADRLAGAIVDVFGINTSSYSDSERQWNPNGSQREQKLYQRVGEKRFQELNKEYNTRVDSHIKELKRDPTWQRMSDEDKQAKLDKGRERIKAYYLGK